MENSQRYQEAVNLFERELYEEAIEGFIELYEAGYEKDIILQNLYSCFVLPNEKEFKKNYERNKEGLTDIAFEKLPIDFIPISDKKYYLFHREYQQFLGNIDLSDLKPKEQTAEVRSLLIADHWDLREMIPYIRESGWNTVYILLDENRNEFLSFLKLPGIEEKLLHNALIFSDLNIMELFFEEYSEYYIPKVIVSKNRVDYQQIMIKLHRKRLENIESPRNNILLSVCIPSYNRGSIALKNVRNLLALEYDSEIEIVVSNNGSIHDAEGYETIRNIKDSRIHYFEFEENQGYRQNIYNLLTLAKGKFLVFASDEDFMLTDRLHEFLNYLYNHVNAGMVYTTGYGVNFAPEREQNYGQGVPAIIFAMNRNYLTGLTLNMEWVRKNNVLERIKASWENFFVKSYTHAAMAVLTVEHTYALNSGIALWSAQKETEYEGLQHYMYYDSRIKQQNDAIEWIEDVLQLQKNEKWQLILERMDKTFFLLEIAYHVKPKEYMQLIDWQKVCSLLYKNDENILEQKKNALSEEEYKGSKIHIENLYLNFIHRNPTKSLLSKQELFSYEMMERIIVYQYQNGKEIDYDLIKSKWITFLEDINLG